MSGFTAKDANGNAVIIASDLVTLGGVAGQAQGFLLTDQGSRVAVIDTTGALKVNQRISGTATQTPVAASASSVTLLASNGNRLGAYFFNDSTSACYISLNGAASTSNFIVKLAAAGAWELPVPGFTGAITCIWDTAAANGMKVTELT